MIRSANYAQMSDHGSGRGDGLGIFHHRDQTPGHRAQAWSRELPPGLTTTDCPTRIATSLNGSANFGWAFGLSHFHSIAPTPSIIACHGRVAGHVWRGRSTRPRTLTVQVERQNLVGGAVRCSRPHVFLKLAHHILQDRIEPLHFVRTPLWLVANDCNHALEAFQNAGNIHQQRPH